MVFKANWGIRCCAFSSPFLQVISVLEMVMTDEHVALCRKKQSFVFLPLCRFLIGSKGSNPRTTKRRESPSGAGWAQWLSGNLDFFASDSTFFASNQVFVEGPRSEGLGLRSGGVMTPD